jgi:hypothetical protein
MRELVIGGSKAATRGSDRTQVQRDRRSLIVRLGRWWLEHWLRFAAVVGPQWR